jgi:hypothetical protein
MPDFVEHSMSLSRALAWALVSLGMVVRQNAPNGEIRKCLEQYGLNLVGAQLLSFVLLKCVYKAIVVCWPRFFHVTVLLAPRQQAHLHLSTKNGGK